MNAEFDWWLLIVGVVVGAGLTWLGLADSARRDRDVLDAELPAEAGWLARTLAEEGCDLDPDTAEAVLRAHRRYLALPPPDAFVDAATLEPVDLPSARIEPGPPDPASAADPPAGPSPSDAARAAERTAERAAGPAVAPRGERAT